MPYPCIHVEGGLIPVDLLDQISTGDAPGQQPGDFGLPRTVRLTDEIAAAWADARIYWEAFQRGLRRLPEDDPATTVTREQWVLPLLRALGYDEVTFMPRAAVIGSSTYAISHRAGPDESAPPLHIAGSRTDLDTRPPTGRPRLSPHALLQEYLNRSESLWGLVTNGYRLRLLRDSALMTRPAFVEFDLQQMLAGEHFADFALFYRLAHRSRLPRQGDDAQFWLERYFQQAIEQGGRVRDRLRDGVEQALTLFGTGFLRHPASESLRVKVEAGQLPAQTYYRQLLRLVYRLLFLMVSEERNLVGPDDPVLADIYRRYYSISHLRDLAEGYLLADERHADLWLGLRQTFRLYEEEELAQKLGMHALDGDLFGPDAIADLDTAHLHNVDFLRALRRLSLYRDDKERLTRRVNYAALDVEELGSVYESLLEYHPVIEEQQGQLTFVFVLGSERKTTGSYYTRPELVQELIKSALEPVIEARLKAAGEQRSRGVGESTSPLRLGSPTPLPEEQALLSLKIVDPAAGSGHFLLAAARRVGRELARVRTGEEYPTPTAFRQAVREVIGHCLYGVDKNPLAVDLCKVALWLEGHNKGLPLTFLDHRIRCGDSLVGVFDLAVLVEGLPDEAYSPVSGDDKKLAADLRKRNKQEREGQLDLFSRAEPPTLAEIAARWRGLSDIPDADVATIHRKQADYQQLRHSPAYHDLETACNMWIAAFFLPVNRETSAHIPTTAAIRNYLASPAAALGQQIGLVNVLAERATFFHWPLEFPDVFDRGPQIEDRGQSPITDLQSRTGFDVVLGNPPWERIKLQEQEFFAAHDWEIARAINKAIRERLIKNLPQTNPSLALAFAQAKHETDAASKFVRGSGRFLLTAIGDVNTYTLFAELDRQLLNEHGRTGIVCPQGIASDKTTEDFFDDLMSSHSLVSLIAFINERFIFPGVLHNFRFCALTLAGSNWKIEQADFAYECQTFDDIKQNERHFTLTKADLLLLNPNTRTAPVFRSSADADLTKKIYRRFPILANKGTGQSPWDVSFLRMLDMATDSSLFSTRQELEAQGFPNKDSWVPLYEGKMIYQYDHRFASFDAGATERSHMLPEVSLANHQDPDYRVLPYYYVSTLEVEKRLGNRWDKPWLLVFRRITSNNLERTMTATILPRISVGHNLPVVFTIPRAKSAALLLALWNSFPFDYVIRQKMAGATLNYFILEQLPVLPPDHYTLSNLTFIVPRVLELVYTAWDIKPFADDLWREADTSLRAVLKSQWEANVAATGGHVGAQRPAWVEPVRDDFARPPFKWDEERRALLRAELDAYYAHLYNLTHGELRYILDPADVYGPEFPGETFRVLKEKEFRQFGEYRTRRLVLEVWERLGL